METQSQQLVAVIEGLSHSFPDGTGTISKMDLDLLPGEFVSLVGPSGCGKSTLLRLVAGLLEPTSGAIRRDPARGVGFVFQSPVLLPWRTVADNVALPGEISGEKRADRRRRVEELLELVGLKDQARRYPSQLSGGMRMRVSIARALSGRPGLLLMDEPFAALDDLTRSRLQEDLISLRAQEGFTTLFVTHNVPEAVYLSDRVLCLSSRPARALSQVRIPEPTERDPEWRTDPRAALLAREISRALGGRGP